MTILTSVCKRFATLNDIWGLFWHWGTGLVKRSVFYIRLNSAGLIFQTHGWGNRKRLYNYKMSWSNNLLNKASEHDLWPNSNNFCDSLGLCLKRRKSWCSWVSDCGYYSRWNDVSWSMRGLRVLVLCRWSRQTNTVTQINMKY